MVVHGLSKEHIIAPVKSKMAEEIDFENGRFSNFEGLVTLTLTFDPAIRPYKCKKLLFYNNV